MERLSVAVVLDAGADPAITTAAVTQLVSAAAGLGVAAILAGLVLGAFIAAAFPSTETEEDLFGETSDALRRQAERLGVDAARTAVEGVASAANEQGLTVDGLTKVGESLTDKVRAVAERGVDTALGETKPANT